MRSLLLLQLASVGVSLSRAFNPSPSAIRIGPPRARNVPALASAAELSQIDEMCIENVAELCLEAEEQCDIEEYEALINQLEEQRAHFERHVERVDGLLHDLRGRDDKSKSVVRADVDSLQESIGEENESLRSKLGELTSKLERKDWPSDLEA